MHERPTPEIQRTALEAICLNTISLTGKLKRKEKKKEQCSGSTARERTRAIRCKHGVLCDLRVDPSDYSKIPAWRPF
jgi:hypothetical protein